MPAWELAVIYRLIFSCSIIVQFLTIEWMTDKLISRAYLFAADKGDRAALFSRIQIHDK